jgi:hypothetical protein
MPIPLLDVVIRRIAALAAIRQSPDPGQSTTTRTGPDPERSQPARTGPDPDRSTPTLD